MPIVTDEFAFYHMPRTGGTWVETVLSKFPGFDKRGSRHDIPQSGGTKLKKRVARDSTEVINRKTFTILRGLLPWLQSWYRYSLSMTDPRMLMPSVPECLFFRKAPRTSFEQYVDYLLLHPGVLVGAYRMYGSGVDTFLRTETLNDDMMLLLSSVGYYHVKELPEPLNVTTDTSINVDLDPQRTSALEVLEAEIFESLG